jgi:hypothetical protein
MAAWPGGGAAGRPELVTHTRTRAPAGAFQMPGAVSVVSVPDRCWPPGARQRARPSDRVEGGLVVMLSAVFLAVVVVTSLVAAHIYRSQYAAVARLDPAVAVLSQSGPSDILTGYGQARRSPFRPISSRAGRGRNRADAHGSRGMIITSGRVLMQAWVTAGHGGRVLRHSGPGLWSEGGRAAGRHRRRRR